MSEFTKEQIAHADYMMTHVLPKTKDIARKINLLMQEEVNKLVTDFADRKAVECIAMGVAYAAMILVQYAESNGVADFDTFKEHAKNSIDLAIENMRLGMEEQINREGTH